MIKGIYTAASGMLAESVRSDVTANNLANANTTGFKREVAVNKEFASVLMRRINDGDAEPVIGRLGLGAGVDEISTVHTTGMVRSTGNPLDVAIDGKGFFAVETPAGIRYTRNGSFTQNSLGELVTADGRRVLGENGPIRLTAGPAHIGEDGRVFSGETEVGRLRLVAFANEKSLVKEGDSLFRDAANQRPMPAAGALRQGFLEQSNVNVVSEMVNLITAYRAYEINAKTVQAHDQLLDKAVNEVGKV